MAKFHINPATGDIGACKALQGGCPFADDAGHFATAKEARAAYEIKSIELEESGAVWPPAGLPKKLIVVAGMADLIRHYNDDVYDGGEGVCLGASAFVSHALIEQNTSHSLVRGEYTDNTGERKAHWWIESSNWIIDPSRGQFSDESYKSGVVRAGNSNYSVIEKFEPGHKTQDLVAAEITRCFGDPDEAEAYHGALLDIDDEARRLFSADDKSVDHSL